MESAKSNDAVDPQVGDSSDRPRAHRSSLSDPSLAVVGPAEKDERKCLACGRPLNVGDHDQIFGSCEAAPEPERPHWQLVREALRNAHGELWQTYGPSERIKPLYEQIEAAIDEVIKALPPASAATKMK